MSHFKYLNEISQNFFGETCTYVADESIELKAVFDMQWIESNNVSTHSLTAQILSSAITVTPAKGHTLIRGSKTYKIEVAQPNSDNTIYTLILKG